MGSDPDWNPELFSGSGSGINHSGLTPLVVQGPGDELAGVHQPADGAEEASHEPPHQEGQALDMPAFR